MASFKSVSDTPLEPTAQLEPDRNWLTLLDRCHACPTILRDIGTLDLAQLCDPMHIDHDQHWQMHEYQLRPEVLAPVLRWLRVSSIQPLDEAAFIFPDLPQRFPDPPLQAISLWEKQIALIEQCSFRWPSDESYSNDGMYSSDKGMSDNEGVSSESRG
jgi:hypothetical protein